MKCMCGCGVEVNPGSKYIIRHHKPALGKNWKLIGRALKNHQEAARRPERKRKLRNAGLKNWQNLDYKKQQLDAMAKGKSVWKGSEKYQIFRKKLSNAGITNWQNLDYRKNQLETIRNGSYPNTIFKNILFRSQGEIGWYKWFETLHVNFGYEVLYTDFTFFDKNCIPVLCMEHHPSNRYGYIATLENQKLYYKERRQMLDRNGFKDIPLIVTTNIDEETKNKIKSMLDFKEKGVK